MQTDKSKKLLKEPLLISTWEVMMELLERTLLLKAPQPLLTFLKNLQLSEYKRDSNNKIHKNLIFLASRYSNFTYNN